MKKTLEGKKVIIKRIWKGDFFLRNEGIFQDDNLPRGKRIYVFFIKEGGETGTN